MRRTTRFRSMICVVSSMNRGTLHMPQYITILTIGTPKKGSLIFANPKCILPGGRTWHQNPGLPVSARGWRNSRI